MNPKLRVTVFAALATTLGSLSLLPVFDSFSWLPRPLLVVAAIAITAAMLQRLRAPAALIPLAMTLVWAGLVTLLYARAVAPLGFIPGPAALRVLHAAMSSGFSDTAQLSAPVPVTHGLSLLATGGIGLVAIVVETLASGLRRPAIAGLPLLAIFTVSAATISHGVGWLPFVYAAAGYLALLLAEGRDRIGRWGRPVRRGRTAVRGQTVTTQLTQVGRRVGFAAISIAVLVPVIIPGLHSGWFGNHHTNGAGGLNTDAKGSTSISPIVSIGQDLNEPVPSSLLTYTTTGTPTYLRLLTLDTFDGNDWTVSSVATPADTKIDKGIPRQAGLAIQPSGSSQTDVTITGLRQSYLPVPATATTVQAHGDWRYNAVNPAIYGRHSATPHLDYKVTSDVYQPTPAFLNTLPPATPDAALLPDLRTPTNLPSVIRVTADQIVSGATTPYEKALALQAWFQAGTYDTTIDTGTTNNALVTFVNDRRGFCEQFAATMALMARLEGIPARVDVGFTPGTKVGSTSSYLITTADAHAWPELYFPGAGWLRFEPTPRTDGQATAPSYADTVAAPKPTSTAPAAAGTPADPHNVPITPAGGTTVKAHAKGEWDTRWLRDVPIGWLIVLLLVLLGIVIAPVARWVTRRRRWTAADTEAARAHAAWDELGDDMRDLRLDWRGDHDTPRRAAATLVATRRLAYDVPAQQALARLTRAEELARYAARPDELRWVDQDPRADEAAVRKALFESVSRTRRLRAHLAPSSTSRFAVNAAARLSDSSGVAKQWIGRRLFRRSDS
jgi:transglutaminase-like putative cysteine protease